MNASTHKSEESHPSSLMQSPDLNSLRLIDLQSLRDWSPEANWRIDTWFYDSEHLIYDVKLSGSSWNCRFIMIRDTTRGTPNLDVVELSEPPHLLHGDPGHIKKILTNWVTFGWNANSTLLRAVKWAILCMKALEAESFLAKDGHRVAPRGLLVIHNTRMDNAESICVKGLSLKYARSGHGIWTRPPSYGLVESSHFTGHLSFLLDLSGLRLKSVQSQAIVVGEDIPLSRAVRVFDLREKRDG